MDLSRNAGGKVYTTARIRRYSSRTPFVLLFGALVMISILVSVWLFDGSCCVRHSSSQIRGQQLRRARSLLKISHETQQQRDSGCSNQTCGDMEIPYPFGLNGCARNRFFELECTYTEGVNSSTGDYHLGWWPFLTGAVTGSVQGSYQNVSSGDTIPYSNHLSSFQVLYITPGTITIETSRIKATYCWAGSEDTGPYGNASLLLPREGPYRISSSNILVAVGCTSWVTYYSIEPNGTDAHGSLGPNSCTNQVFYNFCGFYACSTMSTVPALNVFLQGGGIAFQYFPICGYGTLLSPPSYKFLNASIFGNGSYGIELYWAIQVNGTLHTAPCSSGNDSITISPDYACSPTLANCNNLTVPDVGDDGVGVSLTGYFCTCKPGYQGDGYKNGSSCTDIDECSDSSLNGCVAGACINQEGNYTCRCPHGKHGDGYKNGTRCTGSGSLNTALIIGLSTVSGAFLIVAVSCGLIGWLYRRRQQENHATNQILSRMKVLQEMQSKGGTSICQMFTLDELEKATSNFAEVSVVGIGGFGKIYRGTLDNGPEVAIKRAKRDVGGDPNDAKQFINEVTILSSVNHHNLVKLLGCCLETSPPILVYEFVSNGSLQSYIQRMRRISSEDHTTDQVSVAPKSLDWDQRLQIAIGTAAALSYLHSGTSPPIYHRDVKSANILLDSKYIAKVADFGLSKVVPIDNETKYSCTAIQGTPGYLDPEYFEHYQITEKSDVYSFGVVLLELLTGERAVDFSRPVSDQNLASRCRRLWKVGLFEEIIDPFLNKTSRPGISEAISTMAQVAINCIQKQGQGRPTMKQVEDQLRKLAVSTILPSSKQSSSVNDRSVTQFYISDDEATSISDLTLIARGVFTNSEDPLHSINVASDFTDSHSTF